MENLGKFLTICFLSEKKGPELAKQNTMLQVLLAVGLMTIKNKIITVIEGNLPQTLMFENQGILLKCTF